MTIHGYNLLFLAVNIYFYLFLWVLFSFDDFFLLNNSKIDEKAIKRQPNVYKRTKKIEEKYKLKQQHHLKS
jgi:hypothetical protein